MDATAKQYASEPVRYPALRVVDLAAEGLAVTPAGSKVSNVAILTGIASHDVYHAGQIHLLKRLARGRGVG